MDSTQINDHFNLPAQPYMPVQQQYGPVEVQGYPQSMPTLDAAKVTSQLNLMTQQINAMASNADLMRHEIERLKTVTCKAVHELYEFADFVARNPGMTLDDYLKIEKVRNVVSHAMRTRYPSDAQGIGGFMGDYTQANGATR